MSWVAVDLDGTIFVPSTDGRPEPWAHEAMRRLLGYGHRVTIHTARFHGAHAHQVPAIRDKVAAELHHHGIPYSDIWTEPHKPPADAFIDNRNVAFHGDWPKALANTLALLDVPEGHEKVLDEVTDEGEE